MGTDLRILRITNQDERFYRLLGPFLSRREIVRELGSPVWDDDGKEWFVAMRGSSVVGFAALRLLGKRAHFVSDYVRPEHRRLGIYRALVASRIDAVDGMSCRAVATSCSVPALRTVGFRAIRKRGRFTVMDRQ